MIPLIVQVLRSPNQIVDLTAAGWSQLISEARETGLLSRLAWTIEDNRLLHGIPERPRRHLDGAALYAAKYQRDVLIEIAHLQNVLAPTGVDLVLMKGAAYVASGLTAARGRTFQDIDILVPEPALPKVEDALKTSGWTRGELSRHDERYYYEWMHQIPPLTHPERGSTIDVHHTIVPRTTSLRLDPSALLHESVAVPDVPGVKVLALPDLILHSAVHLFNEGEFSRGLRDVSDMHYLFMDIANRGFSPSTLERRAHELDLWQPYIYARELTSQYFGLPDATQTASFERTHHRPSLMSKCFREAVKPYASGNETRINLARSVLYVRSHLFKMPLHILISHLFKKSFMNKQQSEKTT